MANRYANLVGSNKIKDEYTKINTGFDKVEQDMDAKPDRSIAQVNDVQMGTDDTLTIEGSTGITVTTNPSQKKVTITATGTSTPGAHGPSHNNDGADPIPDLQNLTNAFDAHKAETAGWRTYNSITELGLTEGTETMEEICAAMANKSQLIFMKTTSNTSTAYPRSAGVLRVTKLSNARVNLEFNSGSAGSAYRWIAYYDHNITPNFTGWHEVAKESDVPNYETGSWTPELQFGGASTGISYVDQYGRYTKMGNVVTCEIDIALSSKGSATGYAQIAGLPYTSASSRPYHNNIGGYAGVALPSGATGMAYYIPNGSTIVTLRAIGDNLALTTTFNDTHFTDASFLRAIFTYFI